jgi:hypothetical protein
LFNPFRRNKRRVLMLVSVGEHPAGTVTFLPTAIADRFVARGYAAGELSRPFNEQELNELRSNPPSQTVSV